MFSGSRDGEHRLCLWREFRRAHIGAPVDQVVQPFAHIPIKPRYLDFYTPHSWPSVFEIVHQGHFCYSGICLLTAATLSYLELIKSDSLRFDVISNHVSGHTGLVLQHQGNCHNFIPGSIVTEQYALEHSTLYDSHIIATDKLFS